MLLVEKEPQLRRRAVLRLLEPAQQRRQRLSVGAAGALRRRLGDAHALDGLETQRLRRRLLLADLVEPGAERVAPGLDRELVTGVALERKATGPAVVVDEAHRRAAPLGLAGNAVQHRGGDLLVAVGEDVGPHLDGIADDAFRRRAAAVDLRPDRLDDDAALAVGLALARCLAHRRRRAAPLRSEDAHGMRLERHGLTGRQGERRFAGRAIRKSAEIAVGAGEQRAGIERHRLGAWIGKDEEAVPRRRRVAGIDAQQRDIRRVRRRQAPLRAFDIGGRQLGAQPIDGGDEVGDVDVGVVLALGRRGLDHVQIAPVAPFVADRHEHAG